MGLAYLAETREETRLAIVEQMIADEPENEQQIRDLIAEALHNAATLGFVGVFGRWYSYINAVGVAFRPTDGSPLVALTCGGIVDIISKQKCLDVVGHELVRLTRRLRARLEGRPDTEPGPPPKLSWPSAAE
jgi:DNA-binding IclR family transcriptional regulator